jgi:hypothetical protein
MDFGARPAAFTLLRLGTWATSMSTPKAASNAGFLILKMAQDISPMTDEPTRAIVKSMGWHGRNDKKKFRAVIEFPDGPPGWPISIVWQGWPINITFVEPEKLGRHLKSTDPTDLTPKVQS